MHRAMLRNLSAWGKLPDRCKGQSGDLYHQISRLREKSLSVDTSAPLRIIIYDADFSTVGLYENRTYGFRGKGSSLLKHNYKAVSHPATNTLSLGSCC